MTSPHSASPLPPTLPMPQGYHTAPPHLPHKTLRRTIRFTASPYSDILNCTHPDSLFNTVLFILLSAHTHLRPRPSHLSRPPRRVRPIMPSLSLTLPDLPADIIRHIFSFLRASDIHHLHLALPDRSSLRHHTRDPILWFSLYSRDFLRSPPCPPPLLRVTRTGALDWQAAYAEAQRRKRAIALQKRNAWGFPKTHPTNQNPQSSNTSPTQTLRARFAWAVRLGDASPQPITHPPQQSPAVGPDS